MTIRMRQWKIVCSTVVITAALTGCGANAEQGSNSSVVVNQQQQQQQRPEGGMRMGNGTMGKIKSIDGQAITLYKSSFTPGQQGQGGGEGGSGESEQQGNQPGGQQQGESAERPQMQEGFTPLEGSGMNRDNMFTEETMVITVTDTTTITALSFENEQSVETLKALTDLKADDIITVTLKEGTQEAESITLGGFGGGRGFGGVRPQGSGQPQSDDTTAATK